MTCSKDLRGAALSKVSFMFAAVLAFSVPQ